MPWHGNTVDPGGFYHLGRAVQSTPDAAQIAESVSDSARL